MAEICLKSSYSIMCGGVYSGSSCLFYQLIIRSVVLKIFCFLWSKFLRALGVSNLCSIALQFRLLTPQCMSDCTEPQLSEARLRSVRNRRGASNSSTSQCSVTCGPGLKRRQVRCRYRKKTLPESSCSASARPADVTRCNVTACASYLWTVARWSSVSSARGSVYSEQLRVNWKM